MIQDPHNLFYRRAVILFNLGGPSSIDEVAKFLFNLFYDRAIINLPNPFRYILAHLITRLRKNTAQKIYYQLGGSSPILQNTLLQADALQKQLSSQHHTHGDVNIDHRVFVTMRYSEPYPLSIVEQIRDYDPQDIVLIPLYPQYSSTTTGSFLDFWYKSMLKAKLACHTVNITEYYQNSNFIKAHCALIKDTINNLKKQHGHVPYRLLFSAHGLPKSIIAKGDPYQQQVISTVASIVDSMHEQIPDYQICYQSKVGPKKWLEPSTEHAITHAAQHGIGVIVVPIAFVSEHSETLIELDVEYRELSSSLSIPFYIRVPTLNTNEYYIKCLEDMVLQEPLSYPHITS